MANNKEMAAYVGIPIAKVSMVGAMAYYATDSVLVGIGAVVGFSALEYCHTYILTH
jgi:hypothetical protein